MKNLIFKKLPCKKLSYLIFMLMLIIIILTNAERKKDFLTKAATQIKVVTEAKEWVKSNKNPVYTNNTNPDLSFTGDPGVFLHNGTFYMWYATLVQFYVPDTVPYGPCDGTIFKCALPVELATSKDGINWKKFDRGTANLKDDYVLLRDSEKSWDSGSIETPTIVFDEEQKKFKMWFTGTMAVSEERERYLSHRIGYAESTDGINWKKFDNPKTKDDLYAKSDPILAPRENNWDNLFVADPTVIKDGNKYKMWYGGAWAKGTQLSVSIGYAESDDGITWTRLDKPVLEATKIEQFLNGPNVLKIGDTYELWYYTGGLPGIFYAVSKDGIKWEKKGQLIPLGKKGDWDALETSSPSVVYDKGKYLLFYEGSSCPMEESKRTDKNCIPHMKIGMATKIVK